MTKYKLQITETNNDFYFIDLGWQFNRKDAMEDAEFIVSMLKKDGKGIKEYKLIAC